MYKNRQEVIFDILTLAKNSSYSDYNRAPENVGLEVAIRALTEELIYLRNRVDVLEGNKRSRISLITSSGDRISLKEATER